ncbi:lipid asymmetry maintenance protein MlaB [Massilia sp. ST3]|uniref:STAS domain-containing protein n=1 Tax=Massilia sp. ST3 TaxID=2824903 RepID=UPI001B82A766|nr:STAS domain-containing protein [Massilia sp. ST3]MBQ5947357.1 STAS domain-containing protein [Massilia sp. ST3]
MNATTPRILRIEGELSIYRAAELRQELLAALDGAAALDIDLSAVTELDSAGVQLLLAAGKSAHAGRKALRLLAPSEAVREVFALIDLAGAAGDSLTIA